MGAGPQRSTFTRMRIALVSEHASPLALPGAFDAGSQNLHVAGLATALSVLGHHVVVYTRRDHPHVPHRVQAVGGYDVVHVPAGPALRLSGDEILAHTGDFVGFLKLAWKDRRPDVVHAHGWLSGIAAVLSARTNQVPVVQTYYAVGSLPRPEHRAKDPASTKRLSVERLVGHEVARVVALCSTEARQVLAMGIDRSKVAVVPRGVDLDLFTPRRAPVDRNRVTRIVSVGRLLPRKGFEDVIRALSTTDSVELVIAGGSVQGDVRGDPEAKRLLTLARTLGIDDRLVFAGHVPHAELPALLRSADIVACTPRHRSSGGVALEAMACGVPVVATAVGGLIDAVVDGQTGVLVQQGKPDLLAKALRSLLSDSTQRELLSVAGHDRVQARYSWPRVATDLVRNYEEAAGTRQAARPAVVPARSARAGTGSARR